jgi:hypothetical protein
MPDVQARNEISNAWRAFLLQSQLANDYPDSYSLYLGKTHRNPLLDRLLPALLHIRACSLLDEALEILLAENDIALPTKQLRNDLHGRITVLQESGALPTDHRLHEVRKRRNVLAHEKDSYCGWEDLAADVDSIHVVLEKTGFTGARPKLQSFAERSGMEKSNEPGIAFIRHFRVGVRENDQPAIEFGWTEKVHDLSSGGT